MDSENKDEEMFKQEEMPKEEEEMLKEIAGQQAADGESGGALNLVYQCYQVKQRVRNQVFALDKIKKEVVRSYEVVQIILNETARAVLRANGLVSAHARRARQYVPQNCDKDGCTPLQERYSKIRQISSLLKDLWNCVKMARKEGLDSAEAWETRPRGAIQKWQQTIDEVKKFERELQTRSIWQSKENRLKNAMATAKAATVKVKEAINASNDMNKEVIKSNEKLLDALNILEKYMGVSRENWKTREMLLEIKAKAKLGAALTMIDEVMKMGRECEDLNIMVQRGVSQMVTKVNENKNETAPISGGRKRRRKTRKVKKSRKHRKYREGKKSKKTYLCRKLL